MQIIKLDTQQIILYHKIFCKIFEFRMSTYVKCDSNAVLVIRIYEKPRVY